MIGKEEKGKERINPLHAEEEDDLPLLINDNDFIIKALKAYYQSQSTFRQGLSDRQESITKSFINLSIIPLHLQQQKEDALAQEDNQHQKSAQGDEVTQANPKNASLRDARLASYEALRTNPKPIALEDLFKEEVSSSQAKLRLLVLGRAGIGKTTLSQHIAYRWAMNELWPQFSSVFWLPLRNLNQADYQTIADINLARLIKQECFKTSAEQEISEEAIYAMLTEISSKILLILDGYDEVAHLMHSETSLSQVLQAALRFPNLIVTSRPYAVPDSYVFDSTLEVMGFTEDNIFTYVAHYFNHPEVKLAKNVELIQQFLKDNPNIWGTAHVPINLALICNAWEEASHQGESLNVRFTMTGLYHNLVQAQLKRAVARQGKLIYEVQPQWLEQQNKPALKLLAALAAQGLAQQQIILSAELQQQAFTSLTLDEKEAPHVLTEAVNLGLLQPISKGQELTTSYYFIHLSFQEFFAARYYVEALQKASDSNVHQKALTFIRKHKYNAFYQLVFWFMAGLVSASAKQRPLMLFWQTLLDKPHDELGLTHLRLLIHCMDEAQLDRRIPQQDNLVRVLSQALEAAILGRKLGFFAWLTGRGEDDGEAHTLVQSFTDFLVTELSHTSFLIQEPLFFKQLLGYIKQTKDTNLTTRAIEALAKLNLTAKAEDLICTQAVHGKENEVKRAAINALGRLSNPSAAVIDLLCERAEQDENRWVKLAAINALSLLPNPSSAIIDLLCERAEQDKECEVRQAALNASSNFSDPPSAIIDLFCEQAVQDKNDEVKKVAINALGKLSNPSAVLIDLLCERAGQDENKGVRRAAINALSLLANHSPAIIALLCERAVQDENLWVRQAAIEALSKLPNPSPAVIDLLSEWARQDKHKCIRRAAINALSQLAPRSSAVIPLLYKQVGQDKKVIAKVLAAVSLKSLVKAYLDCANEAFMLELALWIAKRIMREHAGITLSATKLIVYSHRPIVFKLLPQQLQLEQELSKACQRLREDYRLPKVVELNKLPFVLIEERLLRAQEEKLSLLALAGQGLNDSQVKRLVELIPAYPKLCSLDLSNNAITDKGARDLAKLLATHPQLTELYLAANQLSNVGAQALVDALAGKHSASHAKANLTLCRLTLTDNANINPQTQTALNHHLTRNQHLAQVSQRLLKSIKQNNRAAVKQALRDGALITAMTKQGHGPLHVAVISGHQEAAHYLIKKYPTCLNSLNRDGLTAFYLACEKGQWEFVRFLLTLGADINAAGHQGRSALHHASITPDSAVLKYLLFGEQVKERINIDLTDNDGQTALHYAVLAQNERNVRLLLKAGADFSLTNQHGKTPLRIAYEQGNFRLIGYLENAPLRQSSSTPSSASATALPMLKPDNWVKVYLWVSQLKQLSLGHIALETPNFYVSFWPQNYCLHDGLSPVASTFATSLANDIAEEGRAPDETHCFYSLDNQEINAEFVRFYEKPQQWALKGRKKSSNTQNCSGLVYDLLCAGGIKQLVSVDWFTHALPTPNALGKLMQKAQHVERKQYPITTTYTPTSSLCAQQQVSVQALDEGHFVVSLVNQVMTKLDEQTQLHQEHWKNEELARKGQTLELKQEFLRLREQLGVRPTFFPTSTPAQASTSGAAHDPSSSSEEETVVTLP